MIITVRKPTEKQVKYLKQFGIDIPDTFDEAWELVRDTINRQKYLSSVRSEKYKKECAKGDNYTSGGGGGYGDYGYDEEHYDPFF